MGLNDRLGDWSEVKLPSEALAKDGAILDIDGNWLKQASAEQQCDAMRAWFLARYCDPAHETPYISAEGGYIFIHGGPYEPQEEISHRFHALVADEQIDEVVTQLYREVSDQWAPIEGDFDEYDEDFGVCVEKPDTPMLRLDGRLAQINELLSLAGSAHAMALARMFAFSGVITALKSFLWEAMTYAVENDEKALENIVINIDHFRTQPLKLGDIFSKQKALKGLVKGYQQDTVWHKWDKVPPMIVHGLHVKPPSFQPFIDPVKKRHDIVHRSGQTKDGVPVAVETKELTELMTQVMAFAVALNAKMADRLFNADGRTRLKTFRKMQQKTPLPERCALSNRLTYLWYRWPAAFTIANKQAHEQLWLARERNPDSNDRVAGLGKLAARCTLAAVERESFD